MAEAAPDGAGTSPPDEQKTPKPGAGEEGKAPAAAQGTGGPPAVTPQATEGRPVPASGGGGAGPKPPPPAGKPAAPAGSAPPATGRKPAPPAEKKAKEPAGAGIPAPVPLGAPLPLTRRGFLSTVGWAWVTFSAACAAGAAATVRFLFPNVLYEPPLQMKVGRPDDFIAGQVDERFKQRFGVWIVRNDQGIFALSTICTHLGCTPNWLEAEKKFKCPCHGSGFRTSGINFEGPAPRPLERFRIVLDDDGQIVVDKSRIYQYEKGQWSDPESLLRV